MNEDRTLPETLLETVPALVAEWSEYVSRPDYEPGHPYSDATELARLTFGLWEQGKAEELRSTLATLEAILQTADTEMRSVIIVGFIEDLQNILLRNGCDLDKWAAGLGPATREAWVAVSDLWSGRMSAETFNRFLADRDSSTHL